jgi:signal transduction histidine kinase
VPEEKQKHLFKQFGKVSGGDKNSEQANKEGTGLGLFIVQQLINEFGGKVSLTSEFNLYTKVIINIPFVKDLNNLALGEDEFLTHHSAVKNVKSNPKQFSI